MTSQDSSTHRDLTHLAIEVSTHEGSLALFRGDKPLWHESWRRAGSHSELVTPALERGLKLSRLTPRDLDFVSTSIGPGSFTGIRVGINVAKTLGQSLDIPLVGPTTLDVLVHSLPAGEHAEARALVTLNAFKNMVYMAEYLSKDGKWQAMTTRPAARTWHELQDRLDGENDFLFLGDGLQGYEQVVDPSFLARLKMPRGPVVYPSALVLGPLAYEQFRSGKSRPWRELMPLYVRDSEAEENLRSRKRDN